MKKALSLMLLLAIAFSASYSAVLANGSSQADNFRSHDDLYERGGKVGTPDKALFEEGTGIIRLSEHNNGETTPVNASNAKYVEGEILVGFVKEKKCLADTQNGTLLMSVSTSKEDIGAQTADDVSAPSDVRSEEEDIEIVRVNTNGQSVEEAIREYSAMPNVVFAEPNYIIQAAADTPDDTPYQYYPTNVAGGIDVPDWNTDAAISADDVVVAVIDSGVDYTHEDLKDVMWDEGLNYQELVEMGGGKYGFNAAAYVDSANGRTDDPMPSPGVYHGTHVAGTIAASWNDKGVSGVAKNPKLMAIRTSTVDGSITMDNVVAAFDYLCKAYDAGVNVVVSNNSWGGQYISYAAVCAIKEAAKRGIVLVFASGNDGKSIDTRNDTAYMIRSSTNVVFVNASDSQGRQTSFSNYGQYTTDIFSPGAEIVSTMPSTMLYADPRHSEPVCLNDFEGDSSLKIKSDVSLEVPSDHSGFNGSAGYFFTTDVNTMITITCDEDLSVSRPKYLTFMIEKDRVYGKIQLMLLGSRTNGEQFILSDAGVVEEGKWNAVSFALPDDMDYANFQVQMIITRSFPNVAQSPEDDADTVRIDNVMLTNDAWPYYKLSGTSMAAPTVTGEVAMLAAAYPEDNSRKLIARTLGSANKKGALADYCVTGGIANLKNALEGKYSPVIFDAQMDGSSFVVDGEFFSESGELYVNDIPVPTTEWSDSRIAARSQDIDCSSRMLKVEVRNANMDGFNTGTRYVPLKAVNSDFTEIDIPEEMDKLVYMNESAVSLGDSIYFATADSEETQIYITEYNTKTGEWNEITKGSSYGFITGQIVPYKGKIVTIAGKKVGDDYQPQLFLYDPASKEISWMSFDHIGMYTECSLVNYYGELLIIGGGKFDFTDFHPNKEIIKVDMENRKLISVGNVGDLVDASSTSVPFYDDAGNVYLGYTHNIYSITRIIKTSENSFELAKVASNVPPHDFSGVWDYPTVEVAMAYAKEGFLVTLSDMFDRKGEVLSDTYLGKIMPDAKVVFSDVGKLYNSTFIIRPMSVVNGDKYYVLSSYTDSKVGGKTLRYLAGFTELVPEGTLADEKPDHEPSGEPSDVSREPSGEPSDVSREPSGEPSSEPSDMSREPSGEPSSEPSDVSREPSDAPSKDMDESGSTSEVSYCDPNDPKAVHPATGDNAGNDILYLVACLAGGLLVFLLLAKRNRKSRAQK